VPDSLSVIVPVRNAETSLVGQIERLLDLLPDLTPDFEILVVDDGSTDHTVDLARELTQRFPQVRMIRHTQPRGAEATAQTGLSWARGQTVIVQEEPAALGATELRRLWSLRREPPAVQPRGARRADLFAPALLERLATWAQSLRHLADGGSLGSVRMIRDRAADVCLGASETEHRADGAHDRPPHEARTTRATPIGKPQ